MGQVGRVHLCLIGGVGPVVRVSARNSLLHIEHLLCGLPRDRHLSSRESRASKLILVVIFVLAALGRTLTACGGVLSCVQLTMRHVEEVVHD